MIKNWKTALAAMGLVSKKKPTMVFEIDDANGVKLVFPDAKDFTEVIEGASVTAENGDYVVTVDGIITTITVVDGKVTAVASAELEAAKPIEVIAELGFDVDEMVEVLLLMGKALENAEAKTLDNEKTIAEIKVQFTELKSTMSHAGDGNSEPSKNKFNDNLIKR